MKKDSPQKPGHKAAGRNQPRKPKKATASYLENAALYYLERYATSVENLRRVLMRRVEKSVYEHGTDRAEGAAFVDDIVSRFTQSGLVDDAIYARGRVTSLRRRGDSAHAIRMKLQSKGVPADVIDTALQAHARDEGMSERDAALRLAKRRRLGPFNANGDRPERRDKDLAVLARAGFSYDIAKAVIDDTAIETTD